MWSNDQAPGAAANLAHSARPGRRWRRNQRAGGGAGQVLIDLHCHTAPLSSCSSLGVDELVERARAAGIDGVCLTEHDRSWSEAEVRAFGERLNFVVLRGMEITTELGHVLVFGLDRYEPDLYLSANLRRRVEDDDGLMLLAHPARS